MKILKQISHNREGNDCMIYDSFAVISSNDDLFFVHHLKVLGWYGENSLTSTEIQDHEHLHRILNGTNYELSEEEINNLCDYE